MTRRTHVRVTWSESYRYVCMYVLDTVLLFYQCLSIANDTYALAQLMPLNSIGKKRAEKCNRCTSNERARVIEEMHTRNVCIGPLLLLLWYKTNIYLYVQYGLTCSGATTDKIAIILNSTVSVSGDWKTWFHYLYYLPLPAKLAKRL